MIHGCGKLHDAASARSVHNTQATAASTVHSHEARGWPGLGLRMAVRATAKAGEQKQNTRLASREPRAAAASREEDHGAEASGPAPPQATRTRYNAPWTSISPILAGRCAKPFGLRSAAAARASSQRLTFSQLFEVVSGGNPERKRENIRLLCGFPRFVSMLLFLFHLRAWRSYGALSDEDCRKVKVGWRRAEAAAAP